MVSKYNAPSTQLYPKHKKQDHKQHYWETEEILVWTMLGNNVDLEYDSFIVNIQNMSLFLSDACNLRVWR